MIFGLATRILTTTDKRMLAKMAWNFGIKGARSVQLYKKRMKRGEYFPPFLYLSILNSCNLRCQGCWVDVDKPQVKIDLDHAQPHDQRRQVARQFLLRHPRRRAVHAPGDTSTCSSQHPDCFFPGLHQRPADHRQDGEVAAAAWEMCTPLSVRIEGTEVASDERRGKKHVLSRTLASGLDNCIENKLLTGVATSLCQSNIDDLLDRRLAAPSDQARRALRVVPHVSTSRTKDPPGAGIEPRTRHGR